MYHLELDPFDNVAILRYEICKQTQVKAERQKILNLKAKGGESEVQVGTSVF
jgi:hypothetical protein